MPGQPATRPPLGTILWDCAYGLAEREKWWMDTLPRRLRARIPGWPVAETVGLDVGASVGTYTRSLARWCRTVHAVEPNAALASALARSAISNVVVHKMAAGARAGDGYLTDRASAGRRRPLARLGDRDNSGWSQPCEVARLDALIPGSPQAMVVKIDTEGTEGDVLVGMGRLLDVPYLVLMIEIEARHNPAYRTVFEQLADFGLDAYRLFFRRLIRARPGDVLAAARGPGGRFSAFWPWSNNFLFLRPHHAALLTGRTGQNV